MDKKLRNKLIELQTCLEKTIQVLRKVLAEEEIVAKTENVSPPNEEIEEGKAILVEYIGEHRNVSDLTEKIIQEHKWDK